MRMARAAGRSAQIEGQAEREARLSRVLYLRHMAVLECDLKRYGFTPPPADQVLAAVMEKRSVTLADGSKEIWETPAGIDTGFGHNAGRSWLSGMVPRQLQEPLPRPGSDRLPGPRPELSRRLAARCAAVQEAVMMPTAAHPQPARRSLVNPVGGGAFAIATSVAPDGLQEKPARQHMVADLSIVLPASYLPGGTRPRSASTSGAKRISSPGLNSSLNTSGRSTRINSTSASSAGRISRSPSGAPGTSAERRQRLRAPHEPP